MCSKSWPCFSIGPAIALGLWLVADAIAGATPTKDVEPGDYELRLGLLDPSWGKTVLQQVPFSVVD